jgi:flagellar export protein FliJ
MSANPVCWDLLARKAQTTVDARQKELVQANQNLQQLQQSMQRMTQLYAEYGQQDRSEQSQAWDAQMRLNHRQFMAQLLKVQERLSRELRLATMAVEQRADALMQAQLQLRKMNTLQEQQSRKLQAAQAAKDQLRMDELAMMRFNMRTTH